MARDPGDIDISGVTTELRELISASSQLTARLAQRMGMNATDAQALYLLDAKGPLGVAELARELGMRGASATVLVDRLERAGHAVRQRDADDRRRVRVFATPAAMQASLPVWLPTILAIDEIGRSLDPSEQRAVSRYLRRVAEVMATPEDEAAGPGPDRHPPTRR